MASGPRRGLRPRAARAAFVLLLALSVSGCTTRGPRARFERELARHPDRGVVLRNLPVYPVPLPRDPWAATAMVSTYWRRPARPSAVARAAAGTASREGLLRGLEVYAWPRDLWVHLSRGSLDRLRERLRGMAPVIVTLAEEDPDASRRFAVVAGYDDERRELLFHSGLQTTVQDYDSFEAAWQAGGRNMLLLCPPEAEGWSLTPAELLDRARFRESRGAYERALGDYAAVFRLAPGEAAPRVRAGNVYRIIGRDAEAEREYREAVRLDPRNASAMNNLAYLLLETSGSPDESVALAQQAALLEPTNPVVLDTLGLAHHRRGDGRKAAEVLERARGRARGLPPAQQAEIALHLARVHAGNGDLHLAREVLADALRMDPRAEVPVELLPLRDELSRRGRGGTE